MSSRVYLGRLPRDAESRDIEKLTSEFGRTRDVKVLSGFAFVEFENPRDAKDCIRELDGSKFMGERIIAEAAKGGDRERRRFDDERKRERRRGEYRLAVLGLPSRTSWQDLKDLMRKAGEVVFTDVDRNGDGAVEFANERDMEEAIRLFDDYDYNGSRISVKKDAARDRSPARSPPRRRSRSPPRRRSRSPPRRRDSPPPRRYDDSPPRRGRSPSPDRD